MEFLLAVLVVFLLVRYLINREHFRSLEEKIDAAFFRDPVNVQAQIRDLTARIYRLEEKMAELQAPAPPVASVDTPPLAAEVETPRTEAPVTPVYVEPPPLPAMPPPLPVRPPVPEVHIPAPEPEFVPEPQPEPKPVFARREVPQEPAGPTLGERLRTALGGEEWEAFVGGRLLNKIAALIIVVGIALFLGYSFTTMAPVGRSSIAFGVSVSILAAGVWIERAAKYRVFAGGLIGAGWAGLYATAYAIYSLPAAKIIDDPFIGSLGVLAVAAGMILHSLRYRSQALTAVAYFAAFAGLAATPYTPFAVVALIPLALSLLYLAHRLEWFGTAVFGLFATYGTCISRGSSGAPLYPTEALFLTYFLMFELFDLLRVRRRINGGGLPWIAPLNALGFLGLSYFAWSTKAPEQMWLMASFAAALYFLSALARAFLRPMSSFSKDASLGDRIEAGSYELSISLSAMLTGLAIVAHVSGLWRSVGWAIEAEILYLAGVRWKSRLLRNLGAIGFIFSLGDLCAREFPLRDIPAGRSPVFGRMILNWTPPALLHAILFYLNRAVRRPNRVFSFIASLLVAMAIQAEISQILWPTVLILFAAVLFEIGLRKRLSEFRFQAYLWSAAGLVFSILVHGIFGMQGSTVNVFSLLLYFVTSLQGIWVTHVWVPIAVSLVWFYVTAVRCQFMAEDVFPPAERRWMMRGWAVAVVLNSLLLLQLTVSGHYFAIGVYLLSALLFELGLRRLPPQLRSAAYAVWVFGIPARFLYTQDIPYPPSGLTEAVAALTAWFLAIRLTAVPEDSDTLIDRLMLRHAAAAAGTLFAMRCASLVLPEPYIAIAWALMAVAWIEAGLRLNLLPWRWLGHAVAAAVAVQLYTVNFQAPEKLLPVLPVIAAGYYLWYRFGESMEGRIYGWVTVIPVMALCFTQLSRSAAPVAWAYYALALLLAGRWLKNIDFSRQSCIVAAITFFYAVLVYEVNVWHGAAIVAALYAAQWLSEREARTFFSVLATLLLTIGLYREVSGSLLTVAWGGEGLALLGAGFIARERLMRLQGLILFLVCILKLFLYDLRNLETMYRILSFIALGLILLGVSWIYTRFRDHVRRLL